MTEVGITKTASADSHPFTCVCLLHIRVRFQKEAANTHFTIHCVASRNYIIRVSVPGSATSGLRPLLSHQVVFIFLLFTCVWTIVSFIAEFFWFFCGFVYMLLCCVWRAFAYHQRAGTRNPFFLLTLTVSVIFKLYHLISREHTHTHTHTHTHR